jgi:hypothetical protein
MDDTAKRWKKFLEKHNDGHSVTIFGSIVDRHNKPVTGRW